jgi:protein tyrosine/serine phosphatase
VYFRVEYTHGKRLREVDPGRVFRGGQMTVEGFTDAIRQHGIRTVINFQDEYPDPALRQSYLNAHTTPESELCRRLGVRYVFIAPDVVRHRDVPKRRPRAIEEFLAVMDDPASYPVLLHCHAGLHRTGIMTAIYRMEYQGWTVDEAMRELRANGFGLFVSTAANDYIMQYVLTYRRGKRAP